MHIHKLTDKEVQSARNRQHDKKAVLGDGGGLALVCVGRSCTWQLRYMLDGRPRTMGLGSADLISLADARDAAEAARRAVRKEGVDVVAVQGPRARRLARAAAARAAAIEAAKNKTFKQACEGYLKDHARKWTDARAVADWKAHMAKWVYPLIGEVSIAGVDKDSVLSVLKQEVEGEPFRVAKPVQFKRAAGRIAAVIDWAVAGGLRAEGVNPASMRLVEAALPQKPKNGEKHEHHVALPADECPALWRKLAADTETPKIKALMFSLLTASRAKEVLQARWREFDLEAATWTIPAERFKTRREVRVPLCKAAVALLLALPSNRDPAAPVFPQANGRPYAPTVNMNDTMKRFAPGYDQHGTARSTIRDWAAKRGVRFEVCEALLDHKVGDQTSQAYGRQDWFDERLEVFEAWAAHLGAAVASEAKQ